MLLTNAALQPQALSGSSVPVIATLARTRLVLEDTTVQLTAGCTDLFLYYVAMCSQEGGLPVYAEVRQHAARHWGHVGLKVAMEGLSGLVHVYPVLMFSSTAIQCAILPPQCVQIEQGTSGSLRIAWFQSSSITYSRVTFTCTLTSAELQSGNFNQAPCSGRNVTTGKCMACATAGRRPVGR